jgi:hypothetical protein
VFQKCQIIGNSEGLILIVEHMMGNYETSSVGIFFIAADRCLWLE